MQPWGLGIGGGRTPAVLRLLRHCPDVLFEVTAGVGSVSSPKVATDDKDGIAAVTFLPGNNPGVATVKATVMSRAPTGGEFAKEASE